jgi:anti-sigma28 factor (negative regulator of flagellin synthesis)
VRAERIADIRRRIEAGTYDTDATLALALDRMFDELRHD